MNRLNPHKHFSVFIVSLRMFYINLSFRTFNNNFPFIIVALVSCQRAVLNELVLGPNIARNTALSENVFMMVVCIELRIPLFVVGKPGSSKSLAKTVVADNMQGDAARSELFKTLKQVRT